MKVDVDVRDVTGANWTFSTQPDTALREFRRQVQDRLGGKVKLKFRGQSVTQDATLSSLSIQRGEFLVALVTGKARQKAADQAQDRSARRTVSLGSQAAGAASAEPQLAKAASSPAAPSIAPSAEHLGSEGPPSCPSSPSSEPFSLLPGYISRPNVSPVKKSPDKAGSRSDAAAGGFMDTRPSSAVQRSGSLEQAARRSGSLHFDPGAGNTSQADAGMDSGQQTAAGRSGSGSAAQQVTAWAQAHTSSINDAQPSSGSQPAAKVGMRENSLHADALWEELNKEIAAAPILQPDEQQTAPADTSAQPAGVQEAAAAEGQPKPRKRSRVAKPRRPPKSKFQGTGSTGLARKLSEQPISASVASALAQLPLPPVLQRLQLLFGALNTVYSFLLNLHIQATWSTVRDAVWNHQGCKDACLEDIIAMAALCPEVVSLRDRHSFDGSPMSMLQRRALATDAIPAMVQPHMGSTDDVITQQPGQAQPQRKAQSAASPRGEGDIMAIDTDGAGTLLAGDKERYVIEIIDPGRRSKPTADLETFKGLDNVGGEEPGLASGSLGSQPIPHKNSGQSERGINNANSRRAAAFRQGLARAVAHIHDTFLKDLASKQPSPETTTPQPPKSNAQRNTRSKHKAGLGSSSSSKQADNDPPAQQDTPQTQAAELAAIAADFDPLHQSCWHPHFPLDSLTLPELLSAARQVADVRASHEINAAAGLAENGRQDSEGKAGRNGKAKTQPRPPVLSKKFPPCTDTTPMKAEAFLEHLQQLPWYQDQAVHFERMPPRQPQHAMPRFPLSAPSQAALADRGIAQLFSHQAHAIDAVISGSHVVVCTSTASGKSLCYALPIIEALAENPNTCAMLMFPTKALAQDQLRALRSLCTAAFGSMAPHIEVYDGDTAKVDRPEVRDRASILITNPDMLHQSILPVHRQFARILSNLRFVIVDEGHAYRGVFGCHTALVLRRLRRLCHREYRTDPRFVITSATIANPDGHAATLLGVPQVQCIAEDGSPHGPKTFVLWNPPLLKPNGGDSAANMSHTENRLRSRMTKRAKSEWLRAELQDAHQERGRGLRLAQSPDDPWGLSHTDWVAAAGLGKRRRNAAADAMAALEGYDPSSQEARKATRGDTSMVGLNKHISAMSPKRVGKQAPVIDMTQQADSDSTPPAAGSAQHVSQSGGLGGATAGQQSNGDVARPVKRKLGMRGGGPGVSQRAREAAMALVEATVVQRPQRRHLLLRAAFRMQDQPAYQATDIAHRHDDPRNGSQRALIKRCTTQIQGLRPPEQSLRSSESMSEAGHEAVVQQHAGASSGASGNGAHATEGTEMDNLGDAQDRLPSGSAWREQHGAAGVQADKRRSSPIVELSLLLAECIQHGLRTIAFCKTRKLCELVTAYTRETLKTTAPGLTQSISVYRAGYSPQERREIEQALFSGQLMAVAATNALELGVDVGSLDITLHLGFPGSVASLWQQAGRAGRREQASTSIYIAFDGPLDQYYFQHPDQLFGRPIEQSQVDPENQQLMLQHVTCASLELPLLLEDDQAYFGPGLTTTAQHLRSLGLVSRHPEVRHTVALHYTGPQSNPAASVSLRAIDPERYAIVNEADDGAVIEEIEESKAFYEVYDGAVYMYQGRTYLCKKLDLDSRVAVVRPADLKYYTKVRDYCDVHVTGGRAYYQAAIQPMGMATSAACAECEVTTRWMGFVRIWQGSGEAFDMVDLFLPDVQFTTQAAYIRVPAAARQAARAAGLGWRDGLHAASHAMLNCVPLHLLCDAIDMGTECDNPYDSRFRPERLLLYDKHPGGIGLAAQVTPLFGAIMQKALELVLTCDCVSDSGCPACVQHPDCNEYNAVLSKRAGVLVLQATLQAEAEHRSRMALQEASRAAAPPRGFHLAEKPEAPVPDRSTLIAKAE